jgi:hypothetical protein
MVLVTVRIGGHHRLAAAQIATPRQNARTITSPMI